MNCKLLERFGPRVKRLERIAIQFNSCHVHWCTFMNIHVHLCACTFIQGEKGKGTSGLGEGEEGKRG